jgi:hypothetical protein
MSGWRPYTWLREHATHGSFIVTQLDDGSARANRVHSEPPLVEPVGAGTNLYANHAQAMMACEQRIGELDKALLEQSLRDTRWQEMLA